MNLTVVIFFTTYFLILIFRKHQLLAAWAGVLALLLLKLLPLKYALFSINPNVLAIFIATSIITALLYEVGFIDYVAIRTINFIAKKTKDPLRLRLYVMLALVALTGLISSFMENVATILLLYPVGLEVSKKLKVNPSNLLIGMSVAANLEGSALLIGDSPSILTAMFANMDFFDFFFLKAMNYRPSLFFAVQLGFISGLLVLFLLFRLSFKRIEHSDFSEFVEEKGLKSRTPIFFFAGYVLALVFSSFIQNKPANYIVYICAFFIVISVVWTLAFYRRRVNEEIDLLKHIDFQTFFFLIAIFILVGSLSYSGFIKNLANWFVSISKNLGSNPVLAGYILIVVVSMVVSAFVDNIPYTMAMLPVAKLMADSFGVNMYLFIFGMLLGTTIGGNITPIGSLSNVTILGVLKRNNYEHNFWTFAKIGLPFTLFSLAVSSGFVYLIYR
ncbi:MAG: SLC13 family permease [bacterium]|nr:SLC13 family permease [bacterium]